MSLSKENRSSDQEFSIVELGHTKGPGHFIRGIYKDVMDVDKFISSKSNTGVFRTAFMYSDKLDKGNIIGSLYLDIDCEDDFEKVRKDGLIAIAFLKNIFRLKEHEINIYFSGKKGLHILVSYITLGVKPEEKLNERYLQIAKMINDMSTYNTLDLSIYDKRRLFRIPNSKHQATGLFKVEITEEELRTLSIEKIKEISKSNRVLKSNPPKKNFEAERALGYYKVEDKKETNRKRKEVLDYTPPCIKILFNRDTPKGNRNNLVALLSSHIRDRGFSEDKCIERLCEWNEEYCSPMLHKAEIKRTVKSIYSSDKSFGCTTINKFCDCPDEKCNFKKKG